MAPSPLGPCGSRPGGRPWRERFLRPGPTLLAAAVSASWMGGCDTGSEQLAPTTQLPYAVEVEFGGREDEGYIVGRPTDIERAADGSWLIFSGLGVPRRFDSTGAFLGEVGREGQGPGEYGAAMVGARVDGDSLLVLDARLGRATVLDDSLRFGRTIRWEGQIAEVFPIAWPDTVLAVEWPRGLPGRSFRVLSLAGGSAAELVSFGERWPERDFDSYIRFRRYASAPREGRLWTVEGSRYRLRSWLTNGDSLGVLEPQSQSFSLAGTGFGPDSIPRPFVTAVEQLGPDRLAVGISVARDDWFDAWDGLNESGGESQGPAETQLYQGLLEIRTLDAGALVGEAHFDGVILKILPDGKVVTFSEVGPGVPVIRVFRPIGD